MRFYCSAVARLPPGFCFFASAKSGRFYGRLAGPSCMVTPPVPDSSPDSALRIAGGRGIDGEQGSPLSDCPAFCQAAVRPGSPKRQSGPDSWLGGAGIQAVAGLLVGSHLSIGLI